ncbi:MAG: gamma-glutamyltransferase, partial [Candidatus Aminicenantales bacterium]
DAEILIYDAKQKKVVSLNAEGTAPKLATIEWYKTHENGKIPVDDGLLSATVPGVVDAWYILLSHWGTKTFAQTLAPAIEYDVFPYSESTRRQLRILYRIGFTYNRYIEETVFDTTSDSLFNQALSATLSMAEPWGNVEVSVEGSNYLKDFKYNRLRFSANLSLRIWKGLALTVDGRYTEVHDQLALRKGDVTIDELLLRRTELATEYSYSLSVGFSYAFGSVYSNVVNPRFGGGFGGPGGGGGY